jgi:hypothetical protein
MMVAGLQGAKEGRGIRVPKRATTLMPAAMAMQREPVPPYQWKKIERR